MYAANTTTTTGAATFAPALSPTRPTLSPIQHVESKQPDNTAGTKDVLKALRTDIAALPV